MAKRVSKVNKKATRKQPKNKIANMGDKAGSNNFSKRPNDINKTGANKGSKWRKNLLKDLISMDLNASDVKQFEGIKAMFPKAFNGSDKKNYQLFMELRQIALVFSSNESISQRAISEIKDRIDGKPVSTLLHAGADGGPIEYRDLSDEDLDKKIKLLGGGK